MSNESKPMNHNAEQPSAASGCSAADPYIPAQCLREEVKRFKETNRFTPMEVTGFYIQAAVVLDEHEAMVKALQRIAKWFGEFPATGKTWEDGSPMSYSAAFGSNGERDFMRQIAAAALPPND